MEKAAIKREQSHACMSCAERDSWMRLGIVRANSALRSACTRVGGKRSFNLGLFIE